MKTTVAIRKLIVEYQNGTHDPSTETCTLCKSASYHTENNCFKCPNVVFLEYNGLGCVRRGRRIYSLNWNNPNHKLVEFWEKVLKLFYRHKTQEITPEIKAGILKIAEKYK